MKKEALKATLRTIWHSVGKYVVSMLIAGLLTQHVPSIDPQTAQQVGNAVGEAVTQ